MESYTFKVLIESALQFDDGQINQTQSSHPWQETITNEDSSPYTTRAAKLLQQINEIQEPTATYLLANGETLSLIREGSEVQYKLQNALSDRSRQKAHGRNGVFC